MASRVLLLRHPSVGAEYRDRLNGRDDLVLAQGHEQETQSLLRLLQAQACRAIITSPLRQCSEPAGQLAKSMQLLLETDEALAEVDFGAWKGQLSSEVEASDPENARRFRQWDPTFAFPGGESIQSFYNRIVEVTHRICDRPEETIAVMSHGGVIQQMICHLLGLSPRQYLLFDVECGKLTLLNVFGYRGVLIGLNQG